MCPGGCQPISSCGSAYTSLYLPADEDVGRIDVVLFGELDDLIRVDGMKNVSVE